MLGITRFDEKLQNLQRKGGNWKYLSRESRRRRQGVEHNSGRSPQRVRVEAVATENLGKGN